MVYTSDQWQREPVSEYRSYRTVIVVTHCNKENHQSIDYSYIKKYKKHTF